jgi:hypothetical protein
MTDVALLNTSVNKDNVVLFTSAPMNEEQLLPSGYIFCTNSIPKYTIYTLLSWIAENDVDFPKDRPAKLGGAYYGTDYEASLFSAAEEYAKAHPRQYEWSGAYLVNCTATDCPTESFKNCDYIIPPTFDQWLLVFVRSYRNNGYKAKFIGTDLHNLYLDSEDDWRAFNGMIIIRASPWWNDDNEVINLTKELLAKNHPGIRDNWSVWNYTRYLQTSDIYIMLEIIKDSVQLEGDSFSSSLYEAAQNFSLKLDSVDVYGYNETKRYAVNYFGLYEINSSQEDLIRIDPGWYPVVSEP